jgi:hypothetical protein
MPAASSGEQRDVGGGKEMAVADETQAHIASVVKHKRVPRAAMTGRPLKGRAAERRGAGRKGERLNARADVPGGEEHRGREQGIPDCRLRIRSGTFKVQRQTPTLASDSN